MRRQSHPPGPAAIARPGNSRARCSYPRPLRYSGGESHLGCRCRGPGCVTAYERVADHLLFDAKAPQSASRPGGHGAAFDWQLLRNRNFRRPWLLSGGLTVENVARAVRACDAAAVDCSSGVEIAPGVKSPHLIREFVAAARSARFA